MYNIRFYFPKNNVIQERLVSANDLDNVVDVYGNRDNVKIVLIEKIS